MAPWDLQQTLSEATSDVHSFCFSHGHGWAATADYADEAIPYSTSDWTSESPLTAASTYLTDIDISPDGNWLAYGTNAASAHVHSVGGSWPVETSLTDAGSGRTHVQFSRDSNWLAVASADNNVYIYDVSNGFSLEQTLDDASAARYGLSWDEDTSRLAVGGDGDTFRVYNVGNDWSVSQTEATSSTILRGMCFSRDADSQYLAIGTINNDCLIYNTPDWSTVATSTDPTGRVTGVDFSYDNQWLAAGSEDSNVYVYDVADGFSAVTTLGDAGGNVGYYAGGVEFSPDGWLGYGSWDDNAYIHEAPVSDLTTPIAGTVTLNGTPQEGATVYIIDTATDSIVATLTTDANGEFSYSATEDGPFHVTVQHDDGTAQYNAESLPYIQG